MEVQNEVVGFGGGENKAGLNVVSLLLFAGVAALLSAVVLLLPLVAEARLAALVVCLLAGALAGMSARMANQWERAVILRLGRYQGLKGPGIFWMWPFVDRVTMWLDSRVRATGFAAEKTLTADTVPVNVDAVLFWTVNDAEKAALRVEDYREAVAWAAQTALRDIIGKTDLARMLVGRESIDVALQELIDTRTHDWGISVISVEIRDVVIPPALEDAMSRQAQAEREKLARVILADAEVEIAHRFLIAAGQYESNQIALQLRSMNLLYEGMKEKTTLMVVPSGLAESMNTGTYAGLASLMRPGGIGGVS
ncbi:MAG: peptidase [Acidobacteria bacterium RIFCSPLOWO2_02_FULL_67_36]|nr:MAG: peptidase [Acidobacteria bacterium RIFCSPLOWO2_02_FULL_67_36]OFW22662.1 MAG: peptidase [Acidobacteria bacterium RIFCSPLOWO2_12_FULL_66_21]